MTATVRDLVRASHDRYADAPALVSEDGRRRTFAELGCDARGLAAELDRRGVAPAAAVVWALPNSGLVLVVEHAILGSGRVRVALSPRLHPAEVIAIARDCTAGAVFCVPEATESLRAGLPGVPVLDTDELEELLLRDDESDWSDTAAPTPDDLAALMYTSGTTGEPKGATVTHRGWSAMLQGFWTVLPPIGPGDLAVHTAPMSHFGGSVGHAVTLRGGATVPLARFDASEALRVAWRTGATVMPCVPTVLRRLTAALPDSDVDGRELRARLRAVVYGGSPITAADAAAAQDAFGPVLYQCYGLAEALAPLTCLEAREHAGPALASAGRPTPTTELRLRTADGDDCGPDDTGEVCVRGPAVTTGYLNRPEATAAALDAEGWFATGDVGRLSDGFLYLVDRVKDVILSGGFTVYPSEVEAALRVDDRIADVLVFGVPDPRWDETVAAVVETAPGVDLDPDGVVAVSRSRLASYKKPRHVAIVDRLPVTTNGKPDRRRARAELMAARGLVDP